MPSLLIIRHIANTDMGGVVKTVNGMSNHNHTQTEYMILLLANADQM